MTKQFRNAWKFFMENAGYCTPPGRMVCAKHLAQAEEWAEETGVTFAWDWDHYADLADFDCPVSEVLACACISPTGEVLASLSGIADPDRNYRRVIEAELALEAMEECFEREANSVLSL